ncbi:hypothetical protein [Klebsiella aerogenes]|uniref:hypothetical protein n=1 Tax=Klebsiella aerogenes TaxID=548 RepID=UPI001D5CE8DF|nr:hypothetical protein [Klebsiella aerogenes]MCB8448170.1 hypothetical protein [Klebsiella aerogenes]MCB8452357.1 hypothetical protein [Klebsiella aerogenes]
MTQVTKESLSARIAELESGTRSIKEDYQLEAYRMLLSLIDNEASDNLSHKNIPNPKKAATSKRQRYKSRMNIFDKYCLFLSEKTTK